MQIGLLGLRRLRFKGSSDSLPPHPFVHADSSSLLRACDHALYTRLSLLHHHIPRIVFPMINISFERICQWAILPFAVSW